MASKALKIWISFVALFSLPACAPPHRLYLQYDNQFLQSDLDRILAENPLSPTENIKVATLGKGQTVSHHIVQIRDRETPHVHKNHDLTVMVVRGKGYLMLDQKRIALAEGDVLYVPRATVHHFVNADATRSVALVIFSPPFDGEDTLPVRSHQSSNLLLPTSGQGLP